MTDKNMVQAMINKNIRNELSNIKSYINLQQINMMLQTIVNESKEELELANKKIEEEKNKVKDMVRAVDEAAKPLTEEEEPELEQTIAQALKETNTDRNMLIQAMLESLSPIEKLELGKTITKYFPNHTNKQKVTKFKELPTLIEAEDKIESIDKISNTLRKGVISFNNSQELGVERQGSKEKVSIFVSLITSEESDKIPDNINSKDMRVYHAITSLTLMGNKIISLNDLHRNIENNPKAKLRSKRQKEINDSITKLSSTRLFIDCKEERKYYPNLRDEYDGQMINVNRASDYGRGGHKQTSLRLGDISVLFIYASEKNQVLRVNREVANMPINSSHRNHDLNDYILQRVARMKSRKSYLNENHGLTDSDRTIVYKTVYDNLMLKQQTKNKNTLAVWEQRVRENIKRILDHYIDVGYIKGYYDEENKKIIKWNEDKQKDFVKTIKHNREDIKDKCIVIL